MGNDWLSVKILKELNRLQNALADPRVGARDMRLPYPPPPPGIISFIFHAVFGKNLAKQ